MGERSVNETGREKIYGWEAKNGPGNGASDERERTKTQLTEKGCLSPPVPGRRVNHIGVENVHGEGENCVGDAAKCD